MNLIRTQTDGTRIRYTARAKNFVMKFERDTNFSVIEHSSEFISYLITNTTNKTDANWRQIKASCVYYFTQTGLNELANEIELISNGHTVPKSLLNSTSASKKKSVSIEEKNKINAHLMASANSANPSVYDRSTLAMFNAILVTGLRPCEWEHAELFETQLEKVPLTPPILKVKNAKATNGRSFGEYRYLGLSELDELNMNFVKLNLYNCNNRMDSSGKPLSYHEFYELVRIRMNRVVSKIFPRARKRVTLYSARHQLIADLKASGMSLVEIACIVGHGNDVTATEHYGKKRVGNNRIGLPIANAADLKNIRERFHNSIQNNEQSKLKKF